MGTTESGIFIAPLKEWDRLFAEAKANGFDVDEDAESFADWDVALGDGLEQCNDAKE